VQWVAADAVAAGQRDDGPGAPLQTGNSAQAGQAVFPAQLQLHQSHLYIDGKRVRLGAGLTVSAEIKTGKRQIVDYLLSPIRMRAHESLREQ
jgi:hypothetical protein